MQASNPAAGPSTVRSAASIQAEIAALQAQLAETEAAKASKPTRQEEAAARVLVQHSPSPKKKKARTEVVARPARPSFDLSAPLPKAKKEPAPVDLLTERKTERSLSLELCCDAVVDMWYAQERPMSFDHLMYEDLS